MAHTCEPTITPLDIPSKIVRITADIAVDAGPVHTIVLRAADISTTAKKVEVADILWNKFLVKYAQQLAEEGIAEEIADLEVSLASNIEGRTI